MIVLTHKVYQRNHPTVKYKAADRCRRSTHHPTTHHPRYQLSLSAFAVLWFNSSQFSSVHQPSSIPWMYFLHWSVSFVTLIDPSMVSLVHVLMLFIQAVHGLPLLRLPGIVPCTISFTRLSDTYTDFHWFTSNFSDKKYMGVVVSNCTWVPSFTSGHFAVSEQLCNK